MKMDIQDRPLVFIDCETTGLNPLVHEVIEFAAIKGTEELAIRIKPKDLVLAHPKALEVNGYKEEDWKDAVSAEEAAPLIVAFLQDAILVGQNIRFDIGFLNEMLRRAGLEAKIDYHAVSVDSLAYALLVRKGLKSLSLKHICQFLDIGPEPEVHRAINGARCCKTVYEKLISVCDPPVHR